MLTAVAIAFKVIAGELVRMITGPLGIPGGALVGGFYMLWLPLGVALINKKGVALIITLVQSIVLLITGLPGSHGIWTFFTYMIPGLAVEIVMLVKKTDKFSLLHFLLSVILANAIGTFGTNLVFFRLSFLPLMFTLTAAAFSGIVGGLIGCFTFIRVNNSQLFGKEKEIDFTNEQD